MGRFLLIVVLVASATAATTTLRNTSTRLETQQKQAATGDLALAREAADAAHTAVLTAVLRGGRLNGSLPLNRSFEIDGRAVEIERFETRGDTVYFTVAGLHGASTHRISSSYLINEVDFPGPLWVDAPYATATVDPAATIEATDLDGAQRSTYLDYGKLYDYKLDDLLDEGTLVGGFGAALQTPAGTRSGLLARPGLDDVLAQYSTPTLLELYGDVLSAFGDQDVVFGAGHTLAADETYGVYGGTSIRDARFVRVEGDLTVPSGTTLRGNGVLLVEGDLAVGGTLEWDGLVYIRSFAQTLGVDLGSGDVTVRGALVVEQEAPPPGGHMDLTIYRDMTGQWAQPSGEIDMYTNSWTRHTHRSERYMPDRHVVLLDRAAGNPHEAYTKLAETLDDLSPTAEVFFEFDNVDASGLANFTLTAEDTVRTGSVSGGFGRFAQSAAAQRRSRAFEVQDVDQLVVDVRSLRMLKKHFDDVRTDDPEASCSWNTYPWNAGCIPLNWPRNTKWLYNRGGALRVKLYEQTVAAERLLYEAVFYWHRRGAWDTAERDAEVAADDAWRASIEDGTGYGTALDLGPNVTLDFDQERMLPAMRRLGYSSDNIRHLASAAEHTAQSEQNGDVLLCHNGSTEKVKPNQVEAHLAHGDTVGACALTNGNNGSGNGNVNDDADTLTTTERTDWWTSLKRWWSDWRTEG